MKESIFKKSTADYSTPSRRRQLVKERFNKVADAFEAAGRIDALWEPERRKKALLTFMEAASGKYKSYAVENVEETFTEFETTNLSTYSLMDEAAAPELDYPYETRKRTVVFGGHDTFLKAIRLLLPDVKYVDAKLMAFSPEIIRNADIVWIQNNRISHSQYWSIVKICKQAGIQMRYFTYASAEKCARQLVKEDQR